MNSFADVAELADAQVSEACDGDIVEVQVLSSAPRVCKASPQAGSLFLLLNFGTTGRPARIQDVSWRTFPRCSCIHPSLKAAFLGVEHER